MHSTLLLHPIHKPSRLLTTPNIPPPHKLPHQYSQPVTHTQALLSTHTSLTYTTPHTFSTPTLHILPLTRISPPLPYSRLQYLPHTNPQGPHNLSPTPHRSSRPSLSPQHKLPYHPTTSLLPPTPPSTLLHLHITHLHNAPYLLHPHAPYPRSPMHTLPLFPILAFNILPRTLTQQSPHNLPPTPYPQPALLYQHPAQTSLPAHLTHQPAPTNALKLSSLTCPQALLAFTPRTSLPCSTMHSIPFPFSLIPQQMLS
ncbi:hypothetical protein m07a_12170 [Bartonella schoenbuchensis m07a]|uniref:Uncharacterized protein n=1 Tax=Bartonella schoenbuchensis m07a TaxID=1094496 RepID=N6UK74_9HYPH|nr:hypothetical protein m07a_12170 [Bartonella schoenbuchensis m07a]